MWHNSGNMPRRVYSEISDDETGLVFLFSHEGADTSSPLHITTRHQTTPSEAIATFFATDAQTSWNDERLRFETTTSTHLLYWAWHQQGVRVLVITCVRWEG